MNRILILIAAVGLLIGCTTTQRTPEEQAQHEANCAAQERAYLVYLSIINTGGTPSDIEIIAAQAGAIYLAANCGWSGPAPTGTRSGPPEVDEHGVLKVRPPESQPGAARSGPPAVTTEGDWKVAGTDSRPAPQKN